MARERIRYNEQIRTASTAGRNNEHQKSVLNRRGRALPCPSPQRGVRMFSHLYEVVRQRAASEPTAIALGSQHGLLWKTLDSQQLLDQIDQLAVELSARGVSDGDRVIT